MRSVLFGLVEGRLVVLVFGGREINGYFGGGGRV